MRCRWLGDQRGNVLLFTTLMLVVLLVMGGLAIDVFYLTTVDHELQRSMDFAALAGAGKLGFDDTFFPGARAAAHDYALANPYRNPNGGTITLDPNTANTPSGNIVLGQWDGSSFHESLDATVVNAVKCQYGTSIPTSFLRLLGINSLSSSAVAIAWSAPPLNPPPNACTLPIAVTGCAFTGTPGFNSVGCGTAITFISSSGHQPGTDPSATNTGAWANLSGTGNPNPPTVQQAIDDAANGNCTPPAVKTGDPVGTDNGMQQPTFDDLSAKFALKFNASPILTVTNSPSTGDPQVTYSGKGWQAFIPVIDTGSQCPPSTFSGNKTITGWTTFTMTQVLNKAGGSSGFGSTGRCAVINPNDSNSWAYCNDPTLSPSVRGVFGYYSCSILDVLPAPNPGPITARAKLKLVQ